MNRRIFLQQSSSLALMALLSQDLLAKGTLKKFGCQLYSVRDLMPKDAKGTMEKLAKMGYKQFESYSKDPFWGMSASEAKSFLKSIGVDMVSTHLGLADITDEMAAKAAEVGLKYLICPAIGGQASAEAWKKKASEFNEKGEICKKHGLKFGYHNHSYSFENKNGVIGQDILLAESDPSLVIFELDIFWIEASKNSSIEHLTKHKGRYELCHIKQMIANDPKPKQGDLSSGLIDYSKVLRVAKDTGMKYFYVEQEEYKIDSLTSMKVDADYMKELKF
jgi:sugar phosphate isomerase/epimerase